MPRSLSPYCCRGVAAWWLSVALPAQQPAELVQALADPKRRAAAIERLVELRAQAIPVVRDLLVRAADDEVEPSTQMAALTVLRRLGAEAAPVLPELVTMLCRSQDEAVFVVGVRWLLEVVPQVEGVRVCKRIATELRVRRPSPRAIASLQTAEHRLRIGPAPTPEQLLALLADDHEWAQWRAVAIAIIDRPALARADVIEAAAVRFAEVLQTPAGGPMWWAAGDLALMLDRHQGEVDRALLTRALLWHDQSEVKIEGLQRLRVGAAPDAATVRDVVALLDDGAGAVQEFAASTLEGFGAAALPGLSQLFLLAGSERATRRLRTVAERTAQRLLRAVRDAETGPAVAELLDRFAAFAHRQPVPPARTPADAASARVLAALASGLLRTDGGTAFLDEVLRTSGGASPELAVAVVGALPATSGALTVPMLGLLIRIGAPAAAVPEFEERLARIVQANASAYTADALEVLIEASAGPTASDDAVIAACASERPRLALRGVVEAARRGLLGDPAVRQAVRNGVGREDWGHEELGRTRRGGRLSQRLDDDLRAACALALVANGVEDTLGPIADQFGLRKDEVSAWLAEHRSPERLLAALVELEDAVRERTGVDRALRPAALQRAR